MRIRRSARWPYRQDDREWGDDIMWDREKVTAVHRRYNSATVAAAEELLRGHDGGNTIATDGCLLTCLAMTLRLLAPHGGRWTPRPLNGWARRSLFYSDAGLSMVPLYADLVAEATKGRVQARMQEQYFAGEARGRPVFASQCRILRAYRLLPLHRRQAAVVMLKIGTHDDTFASHYVLVDPDWPGSPADDDAAILDPDQPLARRARPWCLSDAYRRLACNGEIEREWRRVGIRANQLSAVWTFARL